MWQYHPVPPAEPDPHPESDALERLTPEECRLLAARVRGKKHKHEGTNCDDWYVVATAGPWTIIAVSDGAESRKLCVRCRASCQEAVRLLFAGLGSHRLKPRTADFARKDDKHAAFLDPEVEFVQQRMHEAFQGDFAAVEKAYRDRADDPAYAKMLTRRLVVEACRGHCSSPLTRPSACRGVSRASSCPARSATESWPASTPTAPSWSSVPATPPTTPAKRIF